MRRSKPTLQRPIFSLFFFFLFLSGMWAEEVVPMAQQNTSTRVAVVNVGVVVDMSRKVGKMGLSCISMALSDFYQSHGRSYTTRLVLHIRDSQNDVVGAAAAALDLIKNVQVQAIIGPTTSMQVGFVIELGEKAQVPIISFSATNPSLSSVASPPYFIRAALNDSSQVRAISAIVQAFGWRQVVPVYERNEFGEGIIPFLIDAFNEIDARVPYRSVISPSATDDQIVSELYKLMTMQTRVFVVHMSSSLGSQIFTKAKEIGMLSEDYVWIITDALTNTLKSMDHKAIDSMQGVLGVKPYIPTTEEFENFNIRWRKKFLQDNPTTLNPELDIFGLWAYDATIALAMAIEKVGVTNSAFSNSNNSMKSTDLESFGASQNGPRLLQALLSTDFKGLSGRFHLVNGQLQSSAYEIVNVIGNGGRRIGFWTAQDGIERELSTSMSTNTKYSTSKDNLRAIIWPGDTTSTPKGWVIPVNGKKLRIGVPVKGGFSQFVEVTHDYETKTPMVRGYCIDVFDAVMHSLPYYVPYEYIPFETLDGESAGSYDELVDQILYGNYDAVVGDITIIASRSQYVDFTLPYTESGVSLVVPTKDSKSKNAWAFLKPLTWDLWVTSFCSFVFIGFVIWVLEHRVNEDFRGPPSHQVGMIFWFSFSTMVFAHKERVVSNLARFVVIIWVFVVLILTQSYTASLTSMLTVKQLQPTVTDISELQKRGDNVGYLEGSFVLGLLKKMNFHDSQLKPYSSPEECDELLSKGTKNGGIAAAIDEIPYTRILLGKYCSKYTVVQPIYKTDGFGFVFPKGSPLVPDVSRAVLNVTEGDQMKKIENAWFSKETNCPEPNTKVSSTNSLGMDSFWGLFLIAGVASFSALITYTTLFLHQHRQLLNRLSPGTSIWQKIQLLSGRFNEKDLSSHTFRKTELHGQSKITSLNGAGGSPSPSPFSMHNSTSNTNGPPSPSSFSTPTDNGSIVFYGDHHGTTASHEYGYPSMAQEDVHTIELADSNQELQSSPHFTNEDH